MAIDDLISFLPRGDAHYFRCEDGTWGVAIAPVGAVGRLATVAVGMNKGVAAWVTEKLRPIVAPDSKD